jgi:peptidyl-prolyl cis-trans isomerase C
VIPFFTNVIENLVKTRFFIFFIYSVLCGCTFNNGRVAASISIAVQVNEHILSVKELSEKMARQLKNLDSLTAKDPNNVHRIKEEIIRNFILSSLTFDYAENQKINVSNTEIDKAANEVRGGYPDDLSFRRTLAEENISLSEWKGNIHQSLIDKKVFEKINEKVQKPSDIDIRKYYTENKEKFRRKERIYLLQIVSDELTKAQAIREEIGKKKTFSELAEKYSVSPEGKNGGKVGWIEKGSVDIFDKAFLLPVGGVSPVLESAYGFHIFKVERKASPGYASIDEVRSEIVGLLLAQKEQAEFMGWLDRQIRLAKILKNQELINSITVETR